MSAYAEVESNVMTLFQILAALFGLWMIYEIVVRSKKKVFTTVELGFWVSVWSLFVIIALFPGLLLGIAHTLKFSRVFDLVVVGVFMVLTITIILSYYAQKETKQRLDKLVEDLAIKESLPQKHTTKARAK